MNQTQPRIIYTALAVLAAFTILGPQRAQAQEDPAHDELRALRTALVEAIVKGDFDETVKHVHPDVVVTWQNNEVCRGRDGLRDFFERMGKDAFKSYKVEPTPDELAILYGGDTGISFGHNVGSYELLGKEFEFHNRWTATLVKENGNWLLAGYHISLNALDNPVLNSAKNTLFTGAGAGVVVGAILGFFIGRRNKAKS
jgi:ketosteroid isomerase-like protein